MLAADAGGFLLRRGLLLATAGLVTAVMAAPAHVATISVSTIADENTAGDSSCSLREAIRAASGNANGDCAARASACATSG
jgi:CSLREA domain-containing protein